MDDEPGESGQAVSTDGDPDQIRDEIEATREALGDTVEALAAKADVKAQAKQKIDETRESVSQRTDEIRGRVKEISPETALNAASGATQKAKENPVPVAAIGAFVGGFLLGRLTAHPEQ